MNGFGNHSGGSLFGQQNSSQSGTGLFGGNSTSSTFGNSQPSQPSALGASGSSFGSSAPKRTQSVGGMFGSAGTGSPAQPSGGLFGSSGATNSTTGTGLFGSSSNNAGSSGLFGGAPATASSSSNPLNKPASSTSFGGGSAPPSTSLFGQNNQQATTSGQQGGFFGSNNNSSSQPPGSGFGPSNQQGTSSSGGSLFGNTQSSGTGLFGASKPASNTAGLFGNQNQPQTQPQQSQGLFGSAPGSSQSSGAGLFGSSGASSGNGAGGASNGLFGSTSSQSGATGTGGSLLGNSTGGGLFGSNPTATTGGSGGLFGAANTGSAGPKPASTSMFGSLSGSTQQSSQPQQQSLHTTIDQASYILQGVSPSQKLYSSLTQPAQKRTAHEAHGYTGYASKETFKAPPKDYTKLPQLHLDPPKSSPVTVSGPSALEASGRTAMSSTTVAHGEPRQWVNSYDRFLKERPTTLIIRREGRRFAALPSPPVSTAPAPVASVAADTTTSSAKLAHDSTLMGDRLAAPIEPDVSLFHRQANNMTVVQVSKRALEEGYYIFPRLETLSGMSKSQLTAVPNLVVGREGFGQIEYPGTVDLSRISNLGDILGTLVVFEAGTVCVYPDEESKALPGHELNLPCTVTIENAWPIDAATRKKITDMEDLRMQKHIARLREKCEADGGDFVTFAQGIWVFRVPHFSKWGLPVEQMIVDAEADKLVATLPQQPPATLETGDHGDDMVVSGVEDLADSDSGDDNMLDVNADPTEAIENWQDQLSHAALSCYIASQESLAAAVSLPESSDLGAVLLPTKSDSSSHSKVPTGNDGSGAAVGARLDQSALAVREVPLRLDMLRRHSVKSSRDNSSLPLLHTRLDQSLLQRLSPKHEWLWSLLETLYAPGGLDQSKLSQWLEKHLSGYPSRPHDDVFETIWERLTTHKLKDAVDHALKSNNPHLAVLISLLDGHNVSSSDADSQIRNWKENRCLTNIPPIVKRVWELAAGAAPAPAGLNWAQWLGMRLWYSSSSVEDAVSKVPASLARGSGPELALIRQVVGSKQLKAVVEELSPLDGFLFLQGLHTVSPITAKQELKCYDNACASLARFLQKDIGDATLAVYVALHITDTEQSFNTVHDILLDVSDSVSLTVMRDLGVPEQLLDEARAAHAKSIHDHLSGAEYLLRAGLYEQAHQLIITTVAPQAVLEKRLHGIEDLLLSLESKKDLLRRWSLGGEVYLQYLRALKAGDLVERYDVKVLCNSCRYTQTPNLLSQAAISIIAKWASATSFARADFGTDVVLNMKFDPSQARLVALQQASRLLK